MIDIAAFLWRLKNLSGFGLALCRNSIDQLVLLVEIDQITFIDNIYLQIFPPGQALRIPRKLHHPRTDGIAARGGLGR
jgi:hypothetical protein